MMQTMPTNVPKISSNFSIELLLKNDSSLEKEPKLHNKCITKSSGHTPMIELPPPLTNRIVANEFSRNVSPVSNPINDSDSLSGRFRNCAAAVAVAAAAAAAATATAATTATTSPPVSAATATAATPSPPSSHHRILSNSLQSPYQQQLPFTPPDNLLSLNAMQQHQQILNTQLHMAAALNYQYSASMQPQAMNFSQIFTNNFHRTAYMTQRFPYGYGSGDFLLHPYRKPKRIRTAFAPLQLLELENAFEGNQYVVGSERKALAKTLNLTETQVKVWFQNRRTKHKRMQQEGNNNNTNNKSLNRSLSDEDDSSQCMDDEDDDDEEINVEDTHFN